MVTCKYRSCFPMPMPCRTDRGSICYINICVSASFYKANIVIYRLTKYLQGIQFYIYITYTQIYPIYTYINFLHLLKTCILRPLQSIVPYDNWKAEMTFRYHTQRVPLLYGGIHDDVIKWKYFPRY